MRTIKDPKKTPEVRRRIDIEEEEAASTKSTPPKKRKAAKNKNEDSLNESGSTIEDGLSDKSFVGSDSVSDTSSLKSTPPKKRGYNKVAKSPELNGEIDDHDHVVESRKKCRPKRVAKKQKDVDKSGEVDEISNKHDVSNRIEVSISPAESPKLLKRAAQKAANEKILGKKKDAEEKETSPKGKKKVSPKAQSKLMKDETDNLDKSKLSQVKKRKLQIEKDVKDEGSSGKKKLDKKLALTDNVQNLETSSPSKPKKIRKTKKQLEKEMTEELKRQTEEQRNSHEKSKACEIYGKADSCVSEGKDESQVQQKMSGDSVENNLAKVDCQQSHYNVKETVNEKFSEQGHTETISTRHVDSEENSSKLLTHSGSYSESKRENDLILSRRDDPNKPKGDIVSKEDEGDGESELDTSFESISSGYRPPDEHEEIGVEDKENNDINDKSANEQTDHADNEPKENTVEHTDSKVEIKCEFCGNISKSKGGHTRHLRKCQPQKFEQEMENAAKVNKVFMCENCDYSAPRRVLVITHMKSHGIFQCKRCKYRTDSEEGLEEHSLAEHKDRSDCKFCKLCNRYVKCNEIPLEKHMEECQGRVPFKCPECDKEFQYESSLKCHVVSHYPDKPKLFSCDQCDYKSNYKANLKKHVRHIHEQKKERDIKCLECDKMFYTEENMRRHLKLHSGDRPYKCEEKDCEKAFKTPNGLKFHQVSHSNEKPLSCTVCFKEFKTERCFIQHNKEVHDGAPKDYKCYHEGCGFAFYKKSGLDRHLAYHSDNRSFFCTFDGCPKAFRTSDALKVHSLQHTNENPVSCEHCEFVCKQKSSLRFHKLKKHPEILQKSVESKQKLVANNTQTLLDQDGAMTILPQNKHLGNVSDILTDIVSSRESEPVKSADPSIMSPASHLHSEEKSSSMTAMEPEATAEPENVPVVETNPVPDATEKMAIKSETTPPKETDASPKTKSTETDLYEFQSEDEDGHKMQPGLLRKEYDKDKPPLPPVSASVTGSRNFEQGLKSPENRSSDKAISTSETPKVRKKPGPKPKPKPEKTEEDGKPKKRGRKKKSETEKKVENDQSHEEKRTDEVKKLKSKKRSGSPKGKKENLSKDSETESETPNKEESKPEKKKRGRKPKEKVVDENKEDSVKKKRGRKKKVKEVTEEKRETPEVDTGEQDATINYSEVEGGELLTDSKDGVSDVNTDSVEAAKNQGTSLISLQDGIRSDIEPAVSVEAEVDITNQVNVVEEDGSQDENGDSKREIAKQDSNVESDSSDLGSDFEEDLKPPPAPRPPPINDSEDGDIESGPEIEDFNDFRLNNEPLRDFESSREISREISRDFESSRDDSVKNPSEVNSVETSTPKTPRDDGQPLSVKMDSVRSVEEHGTPRTPHGQDIGTPHHSSHHGSVPHTPSHSSIPPTPTANPDFETHGIDGRVDDRMKGQNNDENTDESSMPEVDKDYVGRFFEEIQSTPSQVVDQITRMNSMEENNKAKDIQDLSQSDSGVPSSLTSTESNLQMQSPPADLSLKRMEIMSGERPTEEQYQPRSESVTRPTDRIPSVYDSQFPSPLDPYAPSLARDSVLRQAESVKVPSPSPATFMRFPESEAMIQRQKLSTPYDRNIQNLQRITDSALPAPAHTSSSPLLRHDMFSTGVAGTVTRNPFQSSWTGQEVRPAHWGHPTYLQRPLEQHTPSPSSSLFAKDSYLTSRDFMFDPTRVAAERNMFSTLASSQRPDIPHDTFQFERFDLGSYLSSHGYNSSPSVPVDYTRATHSSTQKSLDERYRQSSSGVTDFRALPPTSTGDMFGVNSSFNLEKYGYARDPLYHSQHLSDNPNNPLFPHGVPSQHSMFGRDYPHRSFYSQNTPYGFMNEKNYAAASAKLGHSSAGVPQQRELVPVPRPNMSAPESQLQDPYRHHSSMLYNMMNRYGFE